MNPDPSNQPDAQLGELPDGLRFITRDVFSAALVFPVDLLPKRELAINSIFDPDIYHQYSRDISGF